MKRFTLLVAAVVALFATSCVQADVEDTTLVGGESVVTLSVETNGADSRTIADGEKAELLHYGVYDAAWNLVFAETAPIVDKAARLELKLLTGYTYNFAFWADKGEGAPYTFDFENKTVTVAYGTAANDESRDAFYGVLPNVEVKGAVNKSVSLKRPFAQINFGTSDLALAKKSGFNTDNYTTSLTVSAYTTLNLQTGAVVGSPEEVTFTAAAPQSETPTLQTAKGDYAWISMNYVLYSDSEPALGMSTCTMVATDNNGKSVAVSYPNAPARRNWRTNLVGALFTDSANVDIEIEPDTDNDLNNPTGYYIKNGVYHIQNGEGLKWLAEQVNGGNSFAGTEFVLDGDIDFTATTRAAAELTPIGTSAHSFSGKFDGQGYTISNFQITAQEGHAGLFGYITLGGPIKNLTVENVKIVANHYAGAIVGRGYVNIENCHVNNVDITVSAKDNDWADKAGGVIGQMLEGGSTVKNCTAKNVTLKGYRDLGGITGMAHSNNTVTGCSVENITILQDLSVDYESDKSKIATLGGVVGRRYASATCEDNNEQSVNIETLATNASELETALQVNNCVKVSEGSYTLTSFPAGAKIVGSGANTVLNATSIITVNGAVNIENASIVMSNDGYKGFQGGVDLNLKNCTIEGQPFLYGTKATFEGCTFKQDVKDNYNVWTYAVKEVSFIDCVFNCNGRCVLIYQEGPELVQNVSFEGCTFNAATPANAGKAAVEIGASNLTTGFYTVTINNCTANGFDNGSVSGNPVWNVKNGNRATVIVDGAPVFVEGVAVENGKYELNNCVHILNAEGWAWMEAQADSYFSGKTILLDNDIDFENATIPATRFWDPEYSATFDGQNHTISNFTIAAGDQSALFNGVANISNLKVDNATISGRGYTAVIGGNLYGNIVNCHVSNSNVTGTYWQVGGLVGQWNSGSISNCSVVDTTITAPASVGLIVGVFNEAGGIRKIENCVVKNSAIVQNFSFGADYDTLYGVIAGYLNATVGVVQYHFNNNTIENTTLLGATSTLLYGEVSTGTVFVDGVQQ